MQRIGLGSGASNVSVAVQRTREGALPGVLIATLSTMATPTSSEP